MLTGIPGELAVSERETEGGRGAVSSDTARAIAIVTGTVVATV